MQELTNVPVVETIETDEPDTSEPDVPTEETAEQRSEPTSGREGEKFLSRHISPFHHCIYR